jgi:DNA processing protein
VEEEKKFWIGFNLVKGIGSTRMRALLDHFGSAEVAWHAQLEELQAAGLSPRLAEAVNQTRNSETLTRLLIEIEQKGIQVLTWQDSDYPRRLKEIDQAPPVLYLHGILCDEDQWAVAVVGTRRITAYGRQVTDEIAEGLARQGVTVISGLARGVDSIAHQAALRTEGRTLAVLGSGVDQIYPPEHRKLAEQICQNGAILSDYPPGTAPEATNVPPRNRIISGLAQAVVVVEAGEKSGALITASFAAEQGREVFAVPGYLYAPQSKGTNQLIRAGARIYLELQDILEALNLTRVEQFRSARVSLPADTTEAQLYALLGREPLHVDEIRMQSNLPIERVSAALTMMELKGMVRQVGNMRYIAVFERGDAYRVDLEGE